MADEKIQEWTVTEPFVNLHCSLGEGPCYEPATNTLRFVDIIQKRIHSVSLDEGPDSLKTIQLDASAGVTADIEGVDPQEKILIGTKYGIAILDRKTSTYEYLTKFADGGETNGRIRSNDGFVDPHGRFWLGTMTDFGLGEPLPEGSLFIFDGKKPPVAVLTGLGIPNSVGFSPDNKTVYFTHTTTAEVFAWDYAEDGSLSNKRVHYKHAGTGGPDGFRVDTDGNIWHAIYGESRVIKISPEGKIIGQVKIPTKNATCVEFVGTTLYITTASDDDGEGDSKKYGGGLFRVDIGTTGLKGHARPFKLDA